MISFVVWAAAGVVLADDEAFEAPPISYSTATPRDAVARLGEDLKAGRQRFDGTDRETVQELLAALKIPVSSQALVYSKTSFQNDRIGPSTPRALYFSDDVYVGWAPGGLAELAAMDAVLGPVFYTFDPRPGGRDRFVRDSDCLRCHGGTFVREIPALLARSVYTDGDGRPQLALGSELMEDKTPYERRWGGWYVSGSMGGGAHRGNLLLAVSRDPTSPAILKSSNGSGFDGSMYLAGVSSDVVSLAVLVHQITFHNTLTRANQHCLHLMAYQQGVQNDLKEPVAAEPVWESVLHGFASATEQVLDGLLFKDEALMPPGGIRGETQYPKDFVASGATVAALQPLRELDLRRRLFKNRCSFLIGSEEFERLQPVLRRRVLQRLWRIVDDPETEPRYDYLEAAEREAIRKAVAEGVPRLPAVWRKGE